MPLKAKSTTVPKALKPAYDAVTAITDRFCAEHLDEEYAEYARYAAAALCRKRPSPLASGQPRTWACGILYALGHVNFLSDPSFKPYITLGEMCDRMGVGRSTGAAKSKVVAEALGMRRLSIDWTLPSRMADNPLVWFLEVNGLPVDIRHMPIEVQRIAFEKGLIPYVWGEREDREA